MTLETKAPSRRSVTRARTTGRRRASEKIIGTTRGDRQTHRASEKIIGTTRDDRQTHRASEEMSA